MISSVRSRTMVIITSLMGCHGFVGENMLRGRAGGVKCSTRLMKDAREVSSVPHVGLPAKLVDRAGLWWAWEVGCLVQARVEITGKYARVCTRASKKDKGRILDEVCAVTGWSRDNARRRLVAAARRPPGRRKSAERRARARRYSCDALKVLLRVWAASGGRCGKYLKESMPLLPGLLEASGELDDEPRYIPAVRDELVVMSATDH